MSNKKLNLVLLFGGKSGEHEISLLSAKSVYEALDKEKYNVQLIGIDKKGQWKLGNSSNTLLNSTDPNRISLNPELIEVTTLKKEDRLQIKPIEGSENLGSIDVVLPIMHGTYGEDGATQGFLELLNTAYVGAGVLGSAIAMDKDVMKRLLLQAGIKVAKFKVLKNKNFKAKELDEIIEYLKFPIFVKPANLGSSVGVSKAKNLEELKKAIEEAFLYDTKIILEEYIKGRELEVSVLGTNTDPKASIVGEIKPNHEFYSYESKYLDEKGAEIIIPAKISNEVSEEISEVAIEAFKILECYGMCRADFFLTESEEVYLNEINTIPGFTKISMYPKLWEASGLKYSELLDKLIELAVERKEECDNLKRNFK